MIMAGTDGNSKLAAVSSRTRRSQSAKRIAPPKANAAQMQVQNPVITTKITPAVHTAIAQQVDQQQSQELMQILLHASLCSILYFRSCFPEDCFETRACLNNSSQYKYGDYTSGRQGVIYNGTGGYIKALTKGVSSRADRFLELLETGIFDAFQRKYLHSVHLTMFEDAEYPDNILESWALTLHYTKAACAGERVLSSVDLSHQAGSKITLSQIKLSLNDLIRKLGHSCAELPALPEERHMRVEIGYTSDRPANYFAPGFEQPVLDAVRFPLDENWELSSINAGLVYTGHHAASLKGSHLGKVNADVDNIFPGGMQYVQEVSKFKDVVADLGERAQAVEKRRLKSPFTTRTSPSLPLQDIPAPIANAERQQLRNMLQPLKENPNVQATQSVVEPQLAGDNPTWAKRIVFSYASIDRAERRRDATLPPRRGVVIRTANEEIGEFDVNCACAHVGNEGDMIQCEFCNSWQHLHCMGYLGRGDERIPSIYLCYQCLLIEEEREFQQQCERAVYRRALWLLRGRSFEHAQALGKAIMYSENEAKTVIKHLRHQGLLKKPSSRSKLQIVLDQSADAQRRMEKTHYNPTVGIEHHLEGTPVDTRSLSATACGSQKRALELMEDGSLPRTAHRIYGAGTIDIGAANTPKRARRSGQ